MWWRYFHILCKTQMTSETQKCTFIYPYNTCIVMHWLCQYTAIYSTIQDNTMQYFTWPSSHYNDISIEFEFRPKFEVLWFKMSLTDYNEMLYTSRQCNCHDMCKILLWLIEHILNYSTQNCNWISHSIEKILLVGQGPGDHFAHNSNLMEIFFYLLL